MSPDEGISPAPAQSIETLVARWCARDHERAFFGSDHEVIDSTTTVRALIVEQVLAGSTRDLFHACGVLGRLIGERGGSPTLAASVVDGAREALGGGDAPWIVPARAALAESYAAARQDLSQRESTARWEYPMCAVPLHEGIVAIAAGYPDDDEDALAAWASRVAHAAALAGVRRVVLGGSAPAARGGLYRAEAALKDAFDVAGIELLPSYAPPGARDRPPKNR